MEPSLKNFSFLLISVTGTGPRVPPGLLRVLRQIPQGCPSLISEKHVRSSHISTSHSPVGCHPRPLSGSPTVAGGDWISVQSLEGDFCRAQRHGTWSLGPEPSEASKETEKKHPGPVSSWCKVTEVCHHIKGGDQ